MDNAELNAVIDDVWDGARGEYITTVSVEGAVYRIFEASEGAFRGDYVICGPGFYSDGFPTLDSAIARAVDRAMGE